VAYPIFPTFPGFAYSVVKSPSWATRLQRSISGIERRVQDYAMPIWNFTLTFSLFRDFDWGSFTAPSTEQRTMIDFFLETQGATNWFLFDDISDDSVTAQGFGTGDGTTVAFQLVRQFISGGFSEWITAPNTGTITIYNNGTPVSSSDYTIDSGSGIVTFTSAPGSGDVLTWTGNFYFRVRFTDDHIDLEEFLYQFWEMKQMKLTSIKGPTS
jgi:uncharacterized protein (TIGR02217 family)